MTDSLSGFQKHCSTLSAWSVVAIVIVFSMVIGSILIEIFSDYSNHQLSYSSLAPLSWLIPLPSCLLALNRLKNMLLEFTKGMIFTDSNAEDLKYIGRNFVVSILLMTFIVPGLYSAMRQGWGGISWVDIDRGYAACLFLSSIIWLFGWLISVGAKLQSENESFV